MKKQIIAILAASAALLYFSCQKENALPSLTEESLIEQITAASSVEALTIGDLPEPIYIYVKQNHAPFDIEMAFHAPQLGYEVVLENGLCLFFGTNGNHLNHDGMHGDSGNHHGNSGINHCMAGDTLNAADLPQAALDYIAANYTGNSVVTVVVKPSGKLGVELSGGAVLMFSPNGSFIHVCNAQGFGGHGHGHGNMGGPGWHCDPGGMGGMGGMGHGNHGSMGHGNHGGMGGHHGGMGTQPGSNQPCWGGMGIPVDSLPAVITSYVNTNHPDATVVHAMQTFGDKYFLRLSDCARLIFDENGNILFDSGD
ncbi:MAG: hypothetical protein DYG98_08340 [Haliscomenobacteraceae bacterium CHB4]|nr:hypothetical protein [Haliscomenobacteraceae bacterium CHB4]